MEKRVGLVGPVKTMRGFRVVSEEVFGLVVVIYDLGN